MTEPIYEQRYRTRRRLPAGRAVAAYAGHDAGGRPVVVTVVRPIDADAFLRTMGMVASVRHLDLAPVIEAGRDGEDCFVVTEDSGGADAAALVARGPLPVASAALTAAAAAAGLAALHERGVVHGGVDPATLLQGEDGTVRLGGAGLAVAYPPPDLRPGTAPDVARYLSPEEVTGRAPTAASDVYRLGLVTYLLLTGRHAFDGPDGGIVAQEQLDGVVQPPQLLNPEVPPALAQVVVRALQKDPGARGTAAQFRADIERVLESAVVEPAPVKPRSKAWLWVIGLFAVLAAALAIAWAAGAFDSTAVPETVTVPDVTGMTEAKAGAVLQEAGLKPGDATEVQRDGSVPGTVVGQTPASGKQVERGTAVALEVAAAPSPPASVAIPGVVGQTESDAAAALTSAGFVVVVAKAESESVPAGVVIEQNPGEGVMAVPGAKVDLVVSTGAPTPAPTSSPSP
jgi:hypothetical protein